MHSEGFDRFQKISKQKSVCFSKIDLQKKTLLYSGSKNFFLRAQMLLLELLFLLLLLLLPVFLPLFLLWSQQWQQQKQQQQKQQR